MISRRPKVPAQLPVPVAEYCSHYWPERPAEYRYPALEVNAVADPRAPPFGLEPSLMDPPAVQKRGRTFKEACAGIEIGERDPVDVDRQHAEQQQHAAEQGISCIRRPNVDPLVAAWKRHAHKGHEFRVYPCHARDPCPDRGRRRGEQRGFNHGSTR
jgi:hypothetical protein